MGSGVDVRVEVRDGVGEGVSDRVRSRLGDGVVGGVTDVVAVGVSVGSDPPQAAPPIAMKAKIHGMKNLLRFVTPPAKVCRLN